MPKVQLVELFAHGLGVIDDARLEFGAGFNVITGETGAGKTLLLGALGPKALERVVRTYDGWVPIAGKPHSLKRNVDALRKVATERGRDPNTLQISAFVAPADDGISLEDLKLYKEAGADRLVLFSQGDAIKMAAGKTLEIVRRLAPTVERAAKVN